MTKFGTADHGDSDAVAPVAAARVLCSRCETGVLEPLATRTVFWRGDALMVVRNVPAMACPHCGEEYVDARTAARLGRMRAAGPVHGAVSMLVPVIDYAHPED
ncbi:type II toxin-antitoxin system MqsA family antitoxin [Poseidonocella sp. HB161398]|uniref:type II toxin-antitoxin system MqsA family antitoxin n=1 Tax=Poseidonocella sp. HB161398 TaxID=2320855 RepID=UPI00148705C5|nr:type II toxin-antitoxin system MqsA family antitoxin [Poseidonocella sp. HB161398]